MKLFWKSIGLLSLALLLAGCLERQFAESDVVIDVDRDEIVVPSDVPQGPGLVCDTINVRTNRNWSISIPDDAASWLELSVDGGLNKARVSEETSVILKFKDNESEQERRTELRIGTAEGSRTITVRQTAISYWHSLTYDIARFSSVNSRGDTLSIAFDTNTQWEVKVDEKSSDFIPWLSSTAGKYSSQVKIAVPENEELVSKSASVILSVKGCKPDTIRISQNMGVPYINILKNEEEERLGFITEEGRPGRSLNIKSNSRWTAWIESSGGYEEGSVKISPESGDKTVTTVSITHPYCVPRAGLSEGWVKVGFLVEGDSTPVFVTIKQQPVIRLLFWDELTQAINKSGWPLAYPAINQLQGDDSKAFRPEETFDLILTNGFKMEIQTEMGIVYYSSGGLIFGKSKGDYLEFPAIEGMKLVRVKYVFGYNQGLTGKITDSEGDAVKGGSFSLTDRGQIANMALSGTEINTKYRLVSTNTKRISIRDLVLYYE